jgi:hypothetical protein
MNLLLLGQSAAALLDQSILDGSASLRLGITPASKKKPKPANSRHLHGASRRLCRSAASRPRFHATVPPATEKNVRRLI